MKILRARVNWAPKFDNQPSFKVLVDKIPTPIYEETSPGIFMSDVDGVYDVLSIGGDGRGFGGRTIPITMIDGSIRSLKGPYQHGYAREGVAGVSITEDPKVMERGHTYFSGALSVEALKECAKLTDTWLVETQRSQRVDDLVVDVYPTLRRTPPKGSAKTGVCTPHMDRWRFIYPDLGPWVDVRKNPNQLLHEKSVADLCEIVSSLNTYRPSPLATATIQYAIDIAGLAPLTALVTRGIGEQEWEACRFLCDIATKEVK